MDDVHDIATRWMQGEKGCCKNCAGLWTVLSGFPLRTWRTFVCRIWARLGSGDKLGCLQFGCAMHASESVPGDVGLA